MGAKPDKKAITSLINGVLRSFDQPPAFDPTFALRDTEYYIDKRGNLDVIYGAFDGDVQKIVKDHFDEMRKANSQAIWNTQVQKDHFVEIQHIVRLLALLISHSST